MLKLSEHIVASLGPATMRLRGDTLIVYDPAWSFIWPGGALALTDAVIQILDDAEERQQGVDWRVLFAESLSVEAGVFRPPRGVGNSDVFLSGWHGRREITDVYERLVKAAEDIAEQQEVVYLSELYRTGQARPTYRKSSGGRPGTSQIASRGAETYQFRFAGKVYSVLGPVFSAFIDMGFDAWVPAHAEDGQVPVTYAGIEGSPIIGLMTPVPTTGMTKDASGRDLYFDRAALCWYRPEHAYERLTNSVCHNPLLVGDSKVLSDVLSKNAASPLRVAVGILRLIGRSEKAIEAAYLAARPHAFRNLLAEYRQKFAADLRDLRKTDVTRARARRIAEGVDALREVIEEHIAPVLREDGESEIDLGALPEVLEELKFLLE